MPTREQVQSMIRELELNGLNTVGTKKEIKFLPEVLRESEKISYLTSGFHEKNTWLITCTNERVIFLDKGMFYGLKQKEIPLNKINSIEQKTGLIFGEISIYDGASRTEVTNIMKKTVKPFIHAVNNAIESFRNNAAKPIQQQAGDDLVDQIEKLANLRDKGILTEEEFQAKKTQLMGL